MTWREGSGAETRRKKVVFSSFALHTGQNEVAHQPIAEQCEMPPRLTAPRFRGMLPGPPDGLERKIDHGRMRKMRRQGKDTEFLRRSRRRDLRRLRRERAGPGRRRGSGRCGPRGYDYADPDVNGTNFPDYPPPEGGPASELVHLGKGMTTAEVEVVLDARGLRRAGIWELLAYGEANPDEQRRFPIAALGSSWTDPYGSLRVPYLDGGSGYRLLGLYWDHPDFSWLEYCRFLAVRKSSS